MGGVIFCIRIGIASLLLLLSGQLFGQAMALDLLYMEAQNVFRARVEDMSYGGSNGQGSYFGVDLRVEAFYKGAEEYEVVSFGVLKIDVIDLEFDTMIMDYSFQITPGKSYVFFTDEITSSGQSPLSGITTLTESEIEGVPYSAALERVLVAYDPFSFLTIENVRNQPHSNFAFNKMKDHAGSVFLGEVVEIKKGQNDWYFIAVHSRADEQIIVVNTPRCICRSGEVEIGGQYVFYTNQDELNQFRLVDEWLGIIEAGEYDRFKGK